MWFTLTLALGHNSVRSCQQHVDSREFAEWMAYNKIEPINIGQRMNLHFASLQALTAEVYRNKKKRRKPYKLSDFYVEWRGKKRSILRPTEIWNRFLSIFGMNDDYDS